MDLNQKIIAALLAGFFLIALLRVFQAPLKVAVKLLANTLLGFLALCHRVHHFRIHRYTEIDFSAQT